MVFVGGSYCELVLNGELGDSRIYTGLGSLYIQCCISFEKVLQKGTCNTPKYNFG
jgi:hypothetical protein